MGTTGRLVVVLAAVWVATVVVVGSVDGFVADSDLPPWPVLLAIAVPLAVFVNLHRRPSVRESVLGVDAQLVLALQLWRIAGAAFLFGWSAGELDAEFAIPAGIGDVATAVAALLLLAKVRAGTLERRHVTWFTALGVGDFSVAVVTGALFRPEALDTMPWVLFPALAVPFFSMVHIVNWVQLRELAGRSVSETGGSDHLVSLRG